MPCSYKICEEIERATLATGPEHPSFDDLLEQKAPWTCLKSSRRWDLSDASASFILLEKHLSTLNTILLELKKKNDITTARQE
jgi:hypothetical protein